MHSIKLANYCRLLLILIFALLLVDSTRRGARSEKKRKLSPETVGHTSTDTIISSIKKGDQWRPLKVLVLTPVSGFSHFQLTAKFAEILAERGHYVHFVLLLDKHRLEKRKLPKGCRVTILPTADVKAKINSINDIYLEDYVGAKLIRNVQKVFEQTEYQQKQNWPRILPFFSGFIGAKELALNKEMMKQLEEENFDVGLAEGWNYSLFANFHLLKIPTTIATSVQSIWPIMESIYGLPHPSNVPEFYSVKSGDGLGMNAERQRENAREYKESVELFQTHLNEATIEFNEIIEKHYANDGVNKIEAIGELIRNASYFFVNSHPLFDFTRPVPEKIKFVGGIVTPFKEKVREALERIDAKLAEFINSPHHAKTPATGSSSSSGGGGTASIHQHRGFIIMSFGSGIHTPDVPLWAYEKLLEAISRFPELNFVIKFQKGENPALDALFNSHDNILTMDWVPQTLLLGNPNIVAFISHCGINSVNEAMEFGVPLICVPLFGDQDYNAAFVEQRKIGRHVDILLPLLSHLTIPTNVIICETIFSLSVPYATTKIYHSFMKTGNDPSLLKGDLWKD